MKLENKIAEELKRILDKLGYEIKLDEIVIEHSKTREHGDYAANIAMRLAKVAHKSPRLVAEEIVNNFKLEEVEKIEVAGPGFINFFINLKSLQAVVKEVIKEGKKYGQLTYGNGTKVNVEYVSANPTGDLHLGHARGAAVGDSLVRVLRKCGFDVTAEYYINDGGNQVDNLAKSLLARYKEACGLGKQEMPENGYYGKDVIRIAKSIYKAEGDRLLPLSEDEQLKYLKEKGIQAMFAQIVKDLKKFGVEFDVFSSENKIRQDGKVEEVKAELKPMCYEQDGATYLKTIQDGDDKDRVIVKSDGSYTYLLPDIAYHKTKYDRGFDQIIDVFGADHHGYIARLKSSMKSLGYDPEKIGIVIIQMVRLFKDGQEYKMSKRTGNAVSMRELISDVGVSATRYYFVTRSGSSHLDFDIDLAKSLSSDNPVYYAMYSHARLVSMLDSAKLKGLTIDKSAHLLTEPVEIELLKTIAGFQDAILEAGLTREPYKITIYIQKLASQINEFYTKCRVLDEGNPDLSASRLSLCKASAQTLKNALDLIGVKAPNRM